MCLAMSARSKLLKAFDGNAVTVSITIYVLGVISMTSIHLIMALIEWKLVENRGEL